MFSASARSRPVTPPCRSARASTERAASFSRTRRTKAADPTSRRSTSPRWTRWFNTAVARLALTPASSATVRMVSSDSVLARTESSRPWTPGMTTSTGCT